MGAAAVAPATPNTTPVGRVKVRADGIMPDMWSGVDSVSLLMNGDFSVIY